MPFGYSPDFPLWEGLQPRFYACVRACVPDPSREPANVARENFDPGRPQPAHSTLPNNPVGTGGPFCEAGSAGGLPPSAPVIPTGGVSSPPAGKPPAGRLLAERSPRTFLSPKQPPTTECPRPRTESQGSDGPRLKRSAPLATRRDRGMQFTQAERRQQTPAMAPASQNANTAQKIRNIP